MVTMESEVTVPSALSAMSISPFSMTAARTGVGAAALVLAGRDGAVGRWIIHHAAPAMAIKARIVAKMDRHRDLRGVAGWPGIDQVSGQSVLVRSSMRSSKLEARKDVPWRLRPLSGGRPLRFDLRFYSAISSRFHSAASSRSGDCGDLSSR